MIKCSPLLQSLFAFKASKPKPFRNWGKLQQFFEPPKYDADCFVIFNEIMDEIKPCNHSLTQSLQDSCFNGIEIRSDDPLHPLHLGCYLFLNRVFSLAQQAFEQVISMDSENAAAKLFLYVIANLCDKPADDPSDYYYLKF